MTYASKLSFQPVEGKKRMDVVDILRGFAIFGILTVNIFGMASPIWIPGYVAPILPWYDQIAEGVMYFFGMGKFYVIFSFLFGLGFSLQMERAEEKGIDIHRFYKRRLWILFLFGIIHATVLFIGDILRFYALLGFALLVFRKKSDRTLVLWAVVFLLLNFVTLGVAGGPLAGGGEVPEEMNFALMASQVYQQGSALEVIIFQVGASFFSFVSLFLMQGGTVMSMFLLGLIIGRRQFFQQLDEHHGRLNRFLYWGLPLGLLFNALYMILADSAWVSTFFWILGAPLLGFVYVAGIIRWNQSDMGARLLKPIRYVGRMALTNYLLHSIVGALLFNGYAFGYYELIGPFVLLGITIAIYLAQIPLSVWWLSRYRFGPFEWMWRSLTYRQRQPLRLNPVGAEPAAD